MTGRDHAGVWFPPPLVFLLPLVAAAVLHASRPWPIAAQRSSELRIAGALLVAAALVLVLASMSRFWKADTTILPAGRPTTAIVDRGPYRFTRNPMYLSLAGVYAGLSLIGNNMWALLVLPVVLIIVDVAVIRREERYLSGKFGEDYRRYCSRVRRWI